MAFKLFDRVQETTTSTGTGDISLSGAVSGFSTFASRYSTGDTLYYAANAVDASGAPTGEWEVGIGTYSAASTLTRTTVMASSNSDAAVNFSTGTKRVFVTMTALQGSSIREKLVADRNYYVRTDGSNSNNGLTNTSGGAFLTIQNAIDVAAATLDLGGWSVYVNVGDGTYSGTVTMKSLVGGSNLYIIGNVTTPTNVIVSTTGTCFNNGIAGMKLTIKYLKATAISGNLFVTSSAGSVMSLWGVDCGTATGGSHIATQGGLLYVDANYTISGGATYHYSASTFGEIYSNGKTCTISGTPTFTDFANSSSMGLIYGASNTWTGAVNAATRRYSASGISLINTFGSGSTYYPGGVPGTTASGGQYL